MSGRAWHLVTGEYPPQRGGVADYTRLLARGLAGAGCEVHVWSADADPREEDGIVVHRVEGFGPTGLRELGAALDHLPEPRTLLVQYVPRAFGMHGMNLGFCRWTGARARRGDDVRVMFHEPFLPFSLRNPQHNLPAAVNRLMARELLAAAGHWYVSSPAWERLLRPWAPRGARAPEWLPIPSTIPVRRDADAAGALRRWLARGRNSRKLVGHFGTYGASVGPLLGPILAGVLRSDPETHALLLGGGGRSWAMEFEREYPDLRGRVQAPGRLDAYDLSLHLQVVDVMVQPYLDGATSRRTTLMAALAHGVATVTTTGRHTAKLWSAGPLPLPRAGNRAAVVREVLSLLHDARRRAALGAAAREFYERHFALARTLETLLSDEPAAPAPAP